MTSRDFCYWLQGYFEIAHEGHPDNVDVGITSNRVRVIKKHLNMVFAHEIDPSFANQDKLNEIHHESAKSKPNSRPRC